jgi:molecular chaperone HscB
MSTQLTQSHFELFALPERYVLDEAQLQERYRELQRATHPDKFASAGDQERRIAMQKAVQVNEAYEVLRDPVRRGFYLLELRGHIIEQEKSTTRDTGFLMRQMEFRESLDDVRNRPEPLQALANLRANVNNQMDALKTELASILDAKPDGQQSVAVDMVLKMQFFNRLFNEINEQEAELEDELY